MENTDFWLLKARWPSRFETPAMLANRTIKMVQELQNAGPLLRPWFFWESRDSCLDIREHPECLPAFIEDWVAREEDDTVDPSGGYSIWINNTDDEFRNPSALTLQASAGKPRHKNSLDIYTQCGIAPAPQLLQYKNFKDLTLAVAAAFEPDFIDVRPTALPSSLDFDHKTYARVPPISAGWMVYLSPDLAAQAVVPASLIQEPCPDGGLFLAVTDQTFDVDNAGHRQATSILEKVLDPINGVTPGGMR